MGSEDWRALWRFFFFPYKVQFFLKMGEIAISINLKNKQKILGRSSCNFKRNNGVNISGGNISGVNPSLSDLKH